MGVDPLTLCFQAYECLQRFLQDSPAPVLTDATAVLLQVDLSHLSLLLSLFVLQHVFVQLLVDVRTLPSGSEDVQELSRLLRRPHLQVLHLVSSGVDQDRGADGRLCSPLGSSLRPRYGGPEGLRSRPPADARGAARRRGGHQDRVSGQEQPASGEVPTCGDLASVLTC